MNQWLRITSGWEVRWRDVISSREFERRVNISLESENHQSDLKYTVPQGMLTCSLLPCMRVRLLSFKILIVKAVVELSEWRYLKVKSGARAFQPMGSILVAAWIGSDPSSTAMSSKPIVVWIVWRRAATASCWERTGAGRRAGRVEIRESACNVILVIDLLLLLLFRFY